MLSAPICWMGGKHRLRGEIIKRLPEHRCYCEVFGGAGWVMFGKTPSRCEVYNDRDGDLTNLYRVIKTAHRAFVQACDWLLVSRSLFREFIDTPPDRLDEVRRAVRFFYLINASFGGLGQHFGVDNRNGPALNLATIDQVIAEVHRRLAHVYIEEGDFAAVIERYDTADTIFYLDPPYIGTSEYRCRMEPADYARLVETLAAIRGRFLLSINDCPEAREWFGRWPMEEVEVPYSLAREASGRFRYGELLVRNYEHELRLL